MADKVLSGRVAHGAALAMMAGSGFAGLGYQIVWMQQCALWLGHEAPALMAVVAAFFGGLSLGAWLLSSRIERSRRPGRWYAACETVIGLWGAVLAFLLPSAGAGLQSLAGLQPGGATLWAVTFLGCFMLLLPATLAMGATLPAMQRVLDSVEDRPASPERSWAGLYAANTGGAVAGALGTALLLIPAFGLAATALVCVVLNLAVGLAAWLWMCRGPRGALRAVSRRSRRAASARRTLYSLFLTGLLGIGYELVVVRVLSQVTEDTVYTFAMLLAVYLAGSAAGAAAYRRWQPSLAGQDGRRTTQRLGGALALACLAGAGSLWLAESLRDAVAGAMGAAAGPLAAALVSESVLAVVAFAPATVGMGALFSHLCRCAMARGVSAGHALAANTLGGALASPIVGLLLLPGWGAKVGLLLLACGYAVLGWRRPASPWTWAPLAGAALMAGLAPPLVFVQAPEGARLVAYREGVSAAVSVVEDSQGVSRLYINNHQQEGSNAAWHADGRQALLPLLLHPSPRDALFLGLGTGVTAATATLMSGLDVQAVELLPEVIAASALFTEPLVAQGAQLKRLQLHAADARRFVRVSDQRFDVIVADNFHPARSGSGALYTVEHFQAVRARLASGGLFCQWLPLHQLDGDTVASITASFLAVFPEARALVASNSLSTPVLGLLGAAGSIGWDPVPLGKRVAALPAGRFGLEDPLAVLGSFVAGPASLRRFAAEAPLNTDDRPVVAYRAPRVTYAPAEPPAERLVSLLDRLDPETAGLLVPPTDPGWAARLASYAAARRQFLAAGRGIEPLADPQAMLAQVREPLLAVLRLSPDFGPAYDPLWRLAKAVAPRDPQGARSLLKELAQLQPGRPEAATELRALGTAP